MQFPDLSRKKNQQIPKIQTSRLFQTFPEKIENHRIFQTFPECWVSCSKWRTMRSNPGNTKSYPMYRVQRVAQRQLKVIAERKANIETHKHLTTFFYVHQ